MTRVGRSLHVEYSPEGELRIYRNGLDYPDLCDNVLLVRISGKAFFLQIRSGEMRKKVGLIFEGKLVPDSPARAKEISDMIRLLRGIMPILAVDLPDWQNPREYPRREWLEALRQLDAELARKFRQFLQDGGVAEYLLPVSPDQGGE
jgi:hypothetical protein